MAAMYLMSHGLYILCSCSLYLDGRDFDDDHLMAWLAMTAWGNFNLAHSEDFS